jgi:putative PIN family toxin of toxin-antitoxin system
MIPNRLVLDTNVLLDLFVFHDPRWACLLLALQQGKAEAVTRADCRDEWHHVLRYPHLPLSEETRPAAEAQFEALISMVTAATGSTPLPTCSDRDDQKFLELARDAQASILVTKDKALLKLARRTASAGMFRILTPEAWVREHETTQEAAKPAAVPLE